MKKFSYKNIHQPTSAIMTKIGLACVSGATFIAGYGLTSQNQIVGFCGLAIGFIGSVLTALYPSAK